MLDSKQLANYLENLLTGRPSPVEKYLTDSFEKSNNSMVKTSNHPTAIWIEKEGHDLTNITGEEAIYGNRRSSAVTEHLYKYYTNNEIKFLPLISSWYKFMVMNYFRYREIQDYASHQFMEKCHQIYVLITILERKLKNIREKYRKNAEVSTTIPFSEYKNLANEILLEAGNHDRNREMMLIISKMNSSKNGTINDFNHLTMVRKESFDLYYYLILNGTSNIETANVDEGYGEYMKKIVDNVIYSAVKDDRVYVANVPMYGKTKQTIDMAKPDPMVILLGNDEEPVDVTDKPVMVDEKNPVRKIPLTTHKIIKAKIHDPIIKDHSSDKALKAKRDIHIKDKGRDVVLLDYTEVAEKAMGRDVDMIRNSSVVIKFFCSSNQDGVEHITDDHLKSVLERKDLLFYFRLYNQYSEYINYRIFSNYTFIVMNQTLPRGHHHMLLIREMKEKAFKNLLPLYALDDGNKTHITELGTSIVTYNDQKSYQQSYNYNSTYRVHSISMDNLYFVYVIEGVMYVDTNNVACVDIVTDVVPIVMGLKKEFGTFLNLSHRIHNGFTFLAQISNLSAPTTNTNNSELNLIAVMDHTQSDGSPCSFYTLPDTGTKIEYLLKSNFSLGLKLCVIQNAKNEKFYYDPPAIIQSTTQITGVKKKKNGDVKTYYNHKIVSGFIRVNANPRHYYHYVHEEADETAPNKEVLCQFDTNFNPPALVDYHMEYDRRYPTINWQRDPIGIIQSQINASKILRGNIMRDMKSQGFPDVNGGTKLYNGGCRYKHMKKSIRRITEKFIVDPDPAFFEFDSIAAVYEPTRTKVHKRHHAFYIYHYNPQSNAIQKYDRNVIINRITFGLMRIYPSNGNANDTELITNIEEIFDKIDHSQGTTPVKKKRTE